MRGVDLAAWRSDRKPWMPAVIASLLLSLGGLADPRIWRILAKSAGVSFVLFAAAGAAGWYLIDAGLGTAGLAGGRLAGMDALRGAAAALMTGVGLWLTWRIIAMAVVQFFADDVVAAVEARHYPHAAPREIPLREQLATSLASAARALALNLVVLPVALALLVTGVGTALLFLLVNAWLIGRELQEMVWLRLRRSRQDAAPVGTAERFLLGGVVAALLVVPVANFLAPVLGAAAATHLVHRRIRR